MIKSFQSFIIFWTKYGSFFDKQNFLTSFSFSILIIFLLLDKESVDVLLWIIQYLIAPVVSLCLYSFLPKIKNFISVKPWEDKETFKKWGNWLILFFQIFLIYYLHGTTLIFLSVYLSGKIVFFNAYPILKTLMLNLVFFNLVFLHCISMFSLIKICYQKAVKDLPASI